MSAELSFSYEQRFQLLFPIFGVSPRYVLHSPDIHDLRWSVWDRTERRTIARGPTAVQAVDGALSLLHVEPLQLPLQT